MPTIKIIGNNEGAVIDTAPSLISIGWVVTLRRVRGVCTAMPMPNAWCRQWGWAYVQDAKITVGQFLDNTTKGLVVVDFKRVNLNED